MHLSSSKKGRKELAKLQPRNQPGQTGSTQSLSPHQRNVLIKIVKSFFREDYLPERADTSFMAQGQKTDWRAACLSSFVEGWCRVSFLTHL
jgi:hypothetical protein